VRTGPTINGSPIDGPVRGAAAPGGFAGPRSIVLMLLADGADLVQIAGATGWPARQVRLLGSRHGYLFAADGTPYQPSVQSPQSRPRSHVP
jgi:hypothetical protein